MYCMAALQKEFKEQTTLVRMLSEQLYEVKADYG